MSWRDDDGTNDLEDSIGSKKRLCQRKKFFVGSNDPEEAKQDSLRALSLYLAKRKLVVHILRLFLVLTVATFALRASSLFQGTPTVSVGADRLSSERQG